MSLPDLPRTNLPPTDLPLVSVIMPVYNAERFVGDAIRSILAQTYSHLELIVADDGSADNSFGVAEAFAQRDCRVRLLRLGHGGQSAALNAAVAAAQGQYIALMDADDLAVPERLAVQLDYIERTQVDICGACVQCFGSENKLLWFPESHGAICSELLFRCALLPSTALVRADVLKANRYLPGLIHQDYEMWTRLALRHQLANCQQVLVRYRRHPQQITVRRKAEAQKEVETYRRRFFYTQFPHAEQWEFQTFQRLALKQAHPTLVDLTAAAGWLLQAGAVSDAFLQKRMAERWLGACSRSAGLGMDCFELYHRMAPLIGKSSPRGVGRLRLRCLLRLAAGSRTDQALRALFSRRQIPHAAA